MPFGDVVVRAPKGPVRLHYIDASPTGNVAAPAQVVVLSHGLLLPATKLYPASGIADADCLAFFWRDQIPELCRAGFRCIAYDHRGQGTSERSEDCDLDILADDAIGLIQQLCPGTRVHFVGHSMGGFVGLRVAVKRPDLVQSLALINSSASEDPNRHFYAVLGRLSTWYWPFPGLVASYTVRRILGTSSRADTRQAELVRELVDHIGQVQRYSGVMSITPAAQAVFFRKAVPPTDLARIACPTLILAGDEDVCTRPADSRDAARHIPNCTLHVLPRCGHLAPLECPRAVNRLLLSHLYAMPVRPQPQSPPSTGPGSKPHKPASSSGEEEEERVERVSERGAGQGGEECAPA